MGGGTRDNVPRFASLALSPIFLWRACLAPLFLACTTVNVTEVANTTVVDGSSPADAGPGSADAIVDTSIADADAPSGTTDASVDAAIDDDASRSDGGNDAVDANEAPADAALAAAMDAVNDAMGDSTTDDGDVLGDAVSAAADGDSATHGQRCDDAGANCHCFNLASIGLGGHTGAQSGATMGAAGTDNTQALLAYINGGSSSVSATQVGCGVDVGCTSRAKPDLSAPGFLAQYDVLIFQWMANSLAPVTMMGTSYGFTGDPALGGGGYWVFSQAELDALKTWVMGGGGVIVLSGFDYCPNATLAGCTAGSMGELGPTNQIIEALTDIKYTETDTFGLTQTGNQAYCLGDSDPVGGWAAAPDLLGENIMAVGAFHGRGITPGPNATVDCESGTTVCAAHEDVGKGHVYVYTDEWVTYTSQWNAQLAGYCSLDGSTANGDFPAATAAYQVPQFWTNAIGYAAEATMCPFALAGTIAR